MRWLGLALLLAACGQDNSYFHDPTPSNLGKSPPYDFATMKYPRDLSGVVPDDLTVTPDDLGGGDDLACLANQTCTIDASIPDLAKKPDLLSTDHPG